MEVRNGRQSGKRSVLQVEGAFEVLEAWKEVVDIWYIHGITAAVRLFLERRDRRTTKGLQALEARAGGEGTLGLK